LLSSIEKLPEDIAVDRITDILVIVNPLVEDQPAIAKAATFARWLGASIEMLVCDTKRSREARAEGGLPAAGNAFPSENLESWLEQTAEPLRDDGIDVTTHVICGDPLHEAVTSWMCNSPADLVVKDTHHHSFAKRTFTTHMDCHLIRTCPVPLLLTKATTWGAPPVLMAAVDPGHVNDPSAILDHRILGLATSMAKRCDARVRAAHAYFPSTKATAAAGGMPPIVGVSAGALAAEKDLRRFRIKQLTDQYAIADANLHVDAAMATEYLPRMAAEWQTDIVVMGAIARSGLKRVLIGSTADRVLEALPCDVLVVKLPDFAQNLPF
jgi:universal stress protein E